MTSNERRREARYQRRKQKRQEERNKNVDRYDCFDRGASFSSLLRANKKTRRNTGWKTATQVTQMHLIKKMNIVFHKLHNHQAISDGFIEFDINERGKRRHIRSVSYTERIVQRSMCDNVIIPVVRRQLIYDNGACLSGKGIHWAMQRTIRHLDHFYRKYGNDGYVLQFDFTDYFNSIKHEEAFKIVDKLFRDQELIDLIHKSVIPFGYPVQNTTLKQVYVKAQQGVYSGQSLGLGSQISQIIAITYPGLLDNFIKQSLQVEYYTRYMDDGILLFETKQQAHKALDQLIEVANKRSIIINRKKTKIIKLSRGFTFLKTRFILDKKGKVILRVSRKNIMRQKTKLKKLAILVHEGKLKLVDICTEYASWLGYVLRRGGKTIAQKMNKLFQSLFNISPPKCRLLT